MASRNTDQIQKDWEELCKKEIHFTSLSHPDYPDKLKHIPDPPYSLFYKGSLPAGDIPSVAVVGAQCQSRRPGNSQTVWKRAGGKWDCCGERSGERR